MHCSKYARFFTAFFFLLMVLVSMSVADNPPIASFTTDVITGDIPLLVNFDDESTGEITCWVWDFGDGTELLYLYEDGDTQHTYTSYDTFLVTLTVYFDEYTYSSSTTQIVTYAPLVAGFTADSNNIVVDDIVTFFDESTGNIDTWQWNFGDESPLCDDQNPTHIYTSDGDFIVELTVTDVYSNVSTYNRAFRVSSWSVELKSVGFKSVDTNPEKWHVIHVAAGESGVPYTTDPFDEPQWEDNTVLLNGVATDSEDNKFPICYTSDSTMKVKVILHGKGIIPSLKVKGFNSEGYDFGGSEGQDLNILSFDFNSQDAQDYSIQLGRPVGVAALVFNCDKTFANEVTRYWENLEITWKVKPNGSTEWGTVGISRNQAYVTWKEPISAKNGYLYHTAIHYACYNNDGKSTENEIKNGIWDNFCSANKMVNIPYWYQPWSRQIQYLHYYNSWGATNKETPLLISSGDGTCEAWAKFFIDTLKVQRIKNENNLFSVKHQQIISPQKTYQVSLVVKNWEFKSIKHQVLPNFEYTNFIFHNPDVGPHHQWTFEDVEDKDGVEGQANSDPVSIFKEHALVKLGENEWYDPSYKKKYNSINEFESQAIAGYCINDALSINEMIFNFNFNGINGIENLEVYVNFTCFRDSKLADLILQSESY